MFNATIEADAIQQYAANAGALVDECKIHLDRDGLSTVAVGPANVGMIDQSLSSDAFDSYGADGGVIGVNLVRLLDILGMAPESDSIVSMELDEETRKLAVAVDGLTYTMALIDPGSVRIEPDIPEMDLPAEVVVKWRAVQQAIKAADMIADHVKIAADVDPDALVFEAEGDTDDVSLTLDGDDLRDGTSIEDGYVRSFISLDYLKDVRSIVGVDTEAVLHVGDQFPVEIEWRFADTEGMATVTIAPRIQS